MTTDTIASTPISIRITQPAREISTTIGRVLGADHIAWILRQPSPIGAARARAAGAWTANDMEQYVAYHRTAELLTSARST